MAPNGGLTGPRAGAAPGTARQLIVLLHGYGADGNDLIGLADPYGMAVPTAAFVAPHAPEPCVINPMGRQWFPIPSLDGSAEAAAAHSFGIAVEQLNQFLDAEMDRFDLAASEVALVGFSQGTMMALHVGLRRDSELAGIVGYSGRLLVPERLAGEVRSKPPVLLVHGDVDDLVPVTAVREAADALAAAGVSVTWHISRGTGHGIAPDGLELGRDFLLTRFGVD